MKIKKSKILIMVLSIICLLLGLSTNSYGAYDYVPQKYIDIFNDPSSYGYHMYSDAEINELKSSINKFKSDNLGASAVGQRLMIGYKVLKGSTELYCIEHNVRLDTVRMYEVFKYIEIDCEKIKGPIVSDREKADIILSEILSRKEYGLRYGSGNNRYTDTQKALYIYLKEWVNAGNGSYYGVPANILKSANLTGGTDVVNKIKAEVEADLAAGNLSKYRTKVKMYFLEHRGQLAEQHLLIAVPERPAETELEVYKRDSETDKLLGWVQFTIRNTDTGEYIRSVTHEDAVNHIYRVSSYSTDPTYAGGFPTNNNGYFKVIGLKPGNYEIEEIVNPNPGYEKNVKGRENAVVERIEVHDKKTNSITIYNEKEPTEEPLPEPEPGAGNGNVTISGTVWEDQFTGKINKGNAKNDGEPGVEGVKVYWKSGDTVIANTVTNSSGYYEMKTSIKIENHTYRISKSDWQKINNSYIEFEYNGLKYTTVATGSEDQTGVSKAIENSDYRKRLDAKFSEITKDLVKDSDIKLNYKTTESYKSELEQILDNTADYSDFRVRADTKKIVDKLMEDHANVTGNGSYCVTHCYYDGPTFSNSGWLLDYKGTPYNYETIIEGVDHNRSHAFDDSCYWWETHGDEDDSWDCWHHHSYAHQTCGDIFGDAGHCIKNNSRPNKWEITDMDLGLVKKEQPDLALTSDIDQVRVIMKGQEYTYKYNSRGITKPEDGLFDYKVKFSGKYDTEYRRPVNPSDIAYVYANETDELQVYVKYKIIAKNQSTTLPAMVKEIVNYYDANYTIVSSGWNDTSKYGVSYSGNGYKSAYTQQLDGIFIQPGQDSPLLEIEFRVNDGVVKQLIDGKDLLLKNVSEIHTYSSFYGADTVCAEYKTASVKGWTNRKYAGIDKDSIPGSAVPGKKETYEDDTDQAPTFVLFKDPNYKIISGTVFEDTSVTTNGERLGNGIFDSNENKVENAKVELLRVLDNGETTLAELYLVNGGSPQIVDAVTYTDDNGNYNFTGVVVDNYIIRYTYGNRTNTSTQVDASDSREIDQSILDNPTQINGHEINARNYKSTIITEEPVKSTMKGGEGDQWHLTTPDNVSTAVDYLRKRQAIESLKYSNFDTPINMTAYTKQFNVQVEYTPEQTNDVETDGITIKDTGVKFEHDWSMFDFGIIERPREDIVIDKTISNIKITLANGQVLTEGSPYTEKLNYVKALGTKAVKTREEAVNANEKFLYIEMDSELIQGARLDILYTITVTNNSEIDYEYDYDYEFNYYYEDTRTNERITQDNRAYYYYYGEATTPIIKSTVEWVADYVDPELTCTVESILSNENNTLNRDNQLSIEDVNQVNGGTYTYKDNRGTTVNGVPNWIQITPLLSSSGSVEMTSAARLHEAGLISEATMNKLQEKNYSIFITDYFYDVTSGTSKTLNLFASKLLANQATEYTYENHVEMLQLNGKIARKIESVASDGTQNTKWYKPGNYIPSLSRLGTTSDRTLEQAGLHEQDDDMITIRITPPTGLENNIIIYISVGVVGLIVIAGGIYFIKKKVIG